MLKLTGKTKLIVTIVAAVLALSLIIGLIVALTGRKKADEGFEFASVSFERGGLDESGKYVETKASILTEKAFDCGEAVKVEIDFKSNVTYEVFFYDENGTFVSSEERSVTALVETPDGATLARIVVTPEWEDDAKEVIRLWKVNNYAKQLTVMVKPITEAEED